MTYSGFHENPTSGVVVITTSLREGRTWSPHWRESATVVTLRALLLAVHFALIFCASLSLSSVVLYRYTMFFTNKVNRPRCETNHFASSLNCIYFCLGFPVTARESRFSP